jgi:hypothetical protein
VRGTSRPGSRDDTDGVPCREIFHWFAWDGGIRDDDIADHAADDRARTPARFHTSPQPGFSTTSADGLPITQYLFTEQGPGAIQLNGATNLAAAALAAQGEVLIAAGDLSKLALAPTAASGIVDLYISAYDGVHRSVATGAAITITTNESAVLVAPNIVMQAGSAIPAISLFSVTGFLNPNPNVTGYTIDPAPGSGVVLGNGAYNMASPQNLGAFWVVGSELPFLTYQAPATPGHYSFIINVYRGPTRSWSDWQQINVTVTGPATSAVLEIQNAAAGQPLNAAHVSDSAANLQANPATPLISFAEWFLQSPEYTGNVVHAYAQGTAGDAQFITDSYANLLHRPPAVGDVAWYQNNLINPILTGMAPGSASYSAAELQAHAAVLTDFSASAEFIADVQITASHPADAQHWLILM